MSFSTASSCEKDTENGAPGKFFGPPYFVTALVFSIRACWRRITPAAITKRKISPGHCRFLVPGNTQKILTEI